MADLFLSSQISYINNNKSAIYTFGKRTNFTINSFFDVLKKQKVNAWLNYHKYLLSISYTLR